MVVYDDVGGGYAVRLWWLLRWIVHRRAALLDGGLQAWIAAGGELIREVTRHEPRELTARPDDSRWVDTDALVADLAAARVRVLDARAPERFRGEQEPIALNRGGVRWSSSGQRDPSQSGYDLGAGGISADATSRCIPLGVSVKV